MEEYSDGREIPIDVTRRVKQHIDHIIRLTTCCQIVHLPNREIASCYFPYLLSRRMFYGVLLIVRDEDTKQAIFDRLDSLNEEDHLVTCHLRDRTISGLEDVEKKLCVITVETVFAILEEPEGFRKIANFGAVVIDNADEGDDDLDIKKNLLISIFTMSGPAQNNVLPYTLCNKLIITTSRKFEHNEKFGSSPAHPMGGESASIASLSVQTVGSWQVKTMAHMLRHSEIWSKCGSLILDDLINELKPFTRKAIGQFFDSCLAGIYNNYSAIWERNKMHELGLAMGQYNEEQNMEFASCLDIDRNLALYMFVTCYISGELKTFGNVVAFVASEADGSDLYEELSRLPGAIEDCHVLRIGEWNVVFHDRTLSPAKLNSIYEKDNKYLIISYGLDEGWWTFPCVKHVLDVGVVTKKRHDDNGVFREFEISISPAQLEERKKLIEGPGYYLPFYKKRKPSETIPVESQAVLVKCSALLLMIATYERSLGSQIHIHLLNLMFCENSISPWAQSIFNKCLRYLELTECVVYYGATVGLSHRGAIANSLSFAWRLDEAIGMVVACALGVERPFEVMQSAMHNDCPFICPKERKLDGSPLVNVQHAEYMLGVRAFLLELTRQKTPFTGAFPAYHFENWGGFMDHVAVAQHDVLYVALKVLVQDLPGEIMEAGGDATGMSYTGLTLIKEQRFSSARMRTRKGVLSHYSSFGFEFNKAALYACLGANSYFGKITGYARLQIEGMVDAYSYNVQAVSVNGCEGDPLEFTCTTSPLTIRDVVLKNGDFVLVSFVTQASNGTYKAGLVSKISELALFIASKFCSNTREAMSKLVTDEDVNRIQDIVTRRSPQMMSFIAGMNSLHSDGNDGSVNITLPVVYESKFLPALYRLLHNQQGDVMDLTLNNYCDLVYSVLNGCYTSGNSCTECFATGHSAAECMERPDSARSARIAFTNSSFFKDASTGSQINRNPVKMRRPVHALAANIIEGGYAQTFQPEVTCSTQTGRNENMRVFLDQCPCGKFRACFIVAHKGWPMKDIDHLHVYMSSAATLAYLLHKITFGSEECHMGHWCGLSCPSCYNAKCQMNDYVNERACSIEKEESAIQLGKRLIRLNPKCVICKCRDHSTEEHYRVLAYCKIRGMSLARHEAMSLEIFIRAVTGPTPLVAYTQISYAHTVFDREQVKTAAQRTPIEESAFQIVPTFVVHKRLPHGFTLRK